MLATYGILIWYYIKKLNILLCEESCKDHANLEKIQIDSRSLIQQKLAIFLRLYLVIGKYWGNLKKC